MAPVLSEGASPSRSIGDTGRRNGCGEERVDGIRNRYSCFAKSQVILISYCHFAVFNWRPVQSSAAHTRMRTSLTHQQIEKP